MAKKKRRVVSAGAILDRRHPASKKDLDHRASFRQDMEIAEMIHELRSKAGLSQRELAKLVGTTASAICRLEDADYDGHSMSMLRRVARALGKRIEIRFVSDRGRDVA